MLVTVLYILVKIPLAYVKQQPSYRNLLKCFEINPIRKLHTMRPYKRTSTNCVCQCRPTVVALQQVYVNVRPPERKLPTTSALVLWCAILMNIRKFRRFVKINNTFAPVTLDLPYCGVNYGQSSSLPPVIGVGRNVFGY